MTSKQLVQYLNETMLCITVADPQIALGHTTHYLLHFQDSETQLSLGVSRMPTLGSGCSQEQLLPGSPQNCAWALFSLKTGKLSTLDICDCDVETQTSLLAKMLGRVVSQFQ